MGKLARATAWLDRHSPDLLLWMVWGCVIFNSSSAIADFTNAHHLFPEPWGGYAMAATVDGMLVFAFKAFKRAPWLAGLLLMVAAGTTYRLQTWHAEMVGLDQGPGRHTFFVAAIVPGAMVLVTFTWHAIKDRRQDVVSSVEDRTERELPDRTLPPEPVGSPALGGRARVLDVERPTEELPVSPSVLVGNGHGSAMDRALLVLRERPELTQVEAAHAARVSERTIRNAKARLKEGIR